jgi:carboxymethylenebutenolidase
MYETNLDRRAVIKTALGAGFCAAVAPAWAQVITTPADGLVAGEIKVPANDAEIPAYRAYPQGEGKFPLLLVIHEIFGVHEHIRDVCRRFAKAGYYAVAPDLFARLGDASAETDIQKLMAGIVARTPDMQVESDLDATMRQAVASGKADGARAAAAGFCWGGREVWLYAASHPQLRAAVAWYGPLARPVTPLAPQNPLDLAAVVKVPVLGLYGGQDKGITGDQIAAMREKLAQGASGSKIIVYEDAGHAFYADYRPSYVKADAEASWKEATAWLKSHGV